MNDNTTKFAYAIAVIGGAALWFAATAISGKREAWDATLYWQVFYPLSIMLTGSIAYWVPEKPWRWGLAVMFAQAAALAFVSSSFGLLPLGLMLFALLAVPPILLAKLVAKLRLRDDETR